jgi:hypothetical protein
MKRTLLTTLAKTCTVHSNLTAPPPTDCFTDRIITHAKRRHISDDPDPNPKAGGEHPTMTQTTYAADDGKLLLPACPTWRAKGRSSAAGHARDVYQIRMLVGAGNPIRAGMTRSPISLEDWRALCRQMAASVRKRWAESDDRIE